MAARWSRPGRRGSAAGSLTAARRALGVGALAAVVSTFPACAYLNTFYNAEQAYEQGLRLRSAGAPADRDSLSSEARAAFERAAEKSAIVLARHGDSGYADDALFLLAQSLHELGSHADAAETFRRYVQSFPDGEEAARARLGLVRSERLLGDPEAALVVLAPLLEEGTEGVEPAEVLYEKALIEQETGAHRAALETFRQLLASYPDYARDRAIALRFADAELEAGEIDAALEAYEAFRDRAGNPVESQQVALRVARALTLAGRRPDALAAYGEALGAELPDSVAAGVHAERGDLYAADSSWADAETEYRRAAELAPGSAAAARATLQRGRIAWQVRGQRAAALEILLDAFLHAPLSVHGDSARAEARALARVLHYERLAGGEVVSAIGDSALARSTALYRLGEEVLDAESDPARAATVFARLAERYPGSPWRPRALLAAGLLQVRSGAQSAGEAALRVLIAEHPDTSEADSARRALGLPVAERPGDFYAVGSELATLAAALPEAEDPMERIIDQLDRYADRTPASPARRERPAETGRRVPPDPDRPGSQGTEPPLPIDDEVGEVTP